MGLSARAQKVPSCARLCGRDVHRNFFPIIPLIYSGLAVCAIHTTYYYYYYFYYYYYYYYYYYTKCRSTAGVYIGRHTVL